MNKQEFLAKLRKGLAGLPQDEIEERVSFYAEIIDDRMEEGLSEEDAVGEIGSVEKILSQILADTPFSVLVKEKIKPRRRLRGWEIVLLVLGSPIWLSLAVAAFAVMLSLYLALWSVILSLWIVFGSLIGCAFSGIVVGIGSSVDGNGLSGIAMIGGGIVCAGLSVFLFCGCRAATKGMLILTKRMMVTVKRGFIKKEKA